jgi:Domain of unknown function (DUF4158)
MTRWGFSMPVEFLTDAHAATYGCYARPPSVAELDRCFLLDDKARGLIESKRLPYTRLGFAVQLTTLLFIGRFLAEIVEPHSQCRRSRHPRCRPRGPSGPVRELRLGVTSGPTNRVSLPCLRPSPVASRPAPQAPPGAEERKRRGSTPTPARAGGHVTCVQSVIAPIKPSR